MRKKECLSCGNGYEGKISICQDCFVTIENVRSEFGFFPRGFKKRANLILRIFTLAASVVSLFFLFSIIFISFSTVFLIISTGRGDLIKQIVILTAPQITFFIFGLYLGGYSAKQLTKELIKLWSDRDRYLLPPKMRWYRKTRFFVLLPLFVYVVFMIIIALVKPILIAEQSKTTYPYLFLLGSIIGLRVSFMAYTAGLGFSFYFLTDWIAKLSK